MHLFNKTSFLHPQKPFSTSSLFLNVSVIQSNMISVNSCVRLRGGWECKAICVQICLLASKHKVLQMHAYQCVHNLLHTIRCQRCAHLNNNNKKAEVKWSAYMVKMLSDEVQLQRSHSLISVETDADTYWYIPGREQCITLTLWILLEAFCI